jgi:hypothetical protein
MTYQIIPLPTTPNSSFNVVLDGQQATITLTTTDYGLFASVIYDGVSVANSRLCQDRNDINRLRYLEMPQALFFADLQGTTDPVYTGFNTRYVLVYGEPYLNGGTSGA